MKREGPKRQQHAFSGKVLRGCILVSLAMQSSKKVENTRISRIQCNFDSTVERSRASCISSRGRAVDQSWGLVGPVHCSRGRLMEQSWGLMARLFDGSRGVNQVTLELLMKIAVLRKISCDSMILERKE